MNKRVATACVLLMCVVGAARAAELTPFKVTYDIQFAGLNAGEGIVQLELDGDRLLYTSTVTPRGLFALLFGDTLQVSTRLRREGERVVAEEYTKKYARHSKKDQRYRFEAHGHSVEVLKKGRVYFLATPGGTLDEASMQLQLTRDVRTRGGPWRYTAVSNGKLKRYRFTEVGIETVATTLGEIETVRVERIRVRDGRDDEPDYRYWLSPAHYYLPIRVERLKDGRGERELVVKAIDFFGAGR